MSFNYEFGTQREPPGTQFDPKPPIRCPFDLNFNILEDDDESALSSLESSQLEVPTQYQEVNDDSVVATAEARPTIAMPFDYSWVDWNAIPLRGYKRLQRHKRTHAWWWRFGVPLVGEKFNNKKQVIEEVECFLCKTCHLADPRMERPQRILNGSKGVGDHFRKLHYSTYRENANDATTQFERDEAIEVFSSSDPKQQAVYNRLAKSSDPDVLRKDIFRWIVYDVVPFKKVASPYFKKIVRSVYPLLQTSVVPNPRTVSRWVNQEFPIHKQEIRDNIATSISRVHLAFDLWTSSHKKAINGITANWVDRKGHCCTALLALTEMGDRHSGQAIAQSVVPVIKDYNFGDKLGFFVLDNASSNDTCVAELAKQYKFDPEERRLRCVGHILNLVAQELLYGNNYDKFRGEVANVKDLAEQAALWRAQGPIGMIAQIVRWVNKSPGRVKRFDEAQHRLWMKVNDTLDQPHRRFEPLRLKRDNSTRWNSTRDMLYRARELRNALDEFLDLEYAAQIRSTRVSQSDDGVENQITNLIFTNRLGNDDWAIINEVLDMLEPLKYFTKRMENRPSEHTANGIRDVYDSLQYILSQMEKLKVEYSESSTSAIFWAAIEHAWAKANEYYTKLDNSPVYTAALLFDPRGKLGYLSANWTTTEVDTQLEKVRRMWERDYRPCATNPVQVSPSSSQGRAPLGSLDPNQRPRLNRKRKHTNLDDVLKESRKLNLPRQVGDELTLYLNSELETDENLIPLQYWLREAVRLRYPSLSRFAIDVYSCPAMSSEAERAFSMAGCVGGGKRRRLDEETSEALLCLHHWGNSGLVSVGVHQNDELRGTEVAEFEAEDGPSPEPESDDMWYDGSSD